MPSSIISLWLNLSGKEAKDLFGAILNVSAIAAGFLGAAAPILLTMGATERYERF